MGPQTPEPYDVSLVNRGLPHDEAGRAAQLSVIGNGHVCAPGRSAEAPVHPQRGRAGQHSVGARTQQRRGGSGQWIVQMIGTDGYPRPEPYPMTLSQNPTQSAWAKPFAKPVDRASLGTPIREGPGRAKRAGVFRR